MSLGKTGTANPGWGKCKSRVRCRGSADAAVAIKNVLEEPLGDYLPENVAWQRPIAAFLKIRGFVRALLQGNKCYLLLLYYALNMS